MNRLELKTKTAKENNEKLFCTYLTLGFPSLQFTEELIVEIEKVGVDILELGIPFSDPMADGPIIQNAAYQSLLNNTKIADSFKLVKKLRDKGIQIPIVFFSYYNIILNIGHVEFACLLKDSGFDAVLCPDLPPEEAGDLEIELKLKDIKMVYLVTPTTTDKRRKFICKKSEGFIYYVARKGVTGIQKSVASDLHDNLFKIKAVTNKTILVGFGVSDKEQIKTIAQSSDGVIVGSAIIDKIDKTQDLKKTVSFIKGLVAAVKGCSKS